MPRSRINGNFIDKTFSIVANILLRIIPTTSEKRGFYLLQRCINAFCRLVPLSQSCSKIGLVPRCRIYVESPLSGVARTWVSFLGGHQVHVSLAINQFLDAGVDPKEIPLPHEFILNWDLLAQLYPSFAEGATPFFTLNWSKYREFLTFVED
ncbi:hypothetical protein IFM89_036539 [Coptis chinensis]|uniref:Uncharacterized protein n=1 Tax=Coptis chinensis TaxID=261450 RepID=A0A835M8D8_9MAGN|nr:hypothetical protein IFM89_036539 [Coptis chinensis]